jgi:hypothetical protein
MAEVKYSVCDGCGERIKGPGWKFWKKVNAMRLISQIDEYEYVHFDYEFCDKCGKALRKYLGTPSGEFKNRFPPLPKKRD